MPLKPPEWPVPPPAPYQLQTGKTPPLSKRGLYVGIDNGLDGAIVAIDQDARCVSAELMPTLGSAKRTLDLRALWELLSNLKRFDEGPHFDTIFVVLERAQAMPKQGGVSMFNYGMNYGSMQMALMTLQFQHEIVGPQTWQKAVGIVRGKDTKPQAIQIVQRRIPMLNLLPARKRTPHIGLADAGCMALYARMISVK